MGCELSESNISALIAAISALVGVVIGILGEHQLNAMRQRKIVRGVKQAFYEELNSFWKKLKKAVDFSWKDFDQKKIEYFDCPLSLSPDYLTIYRSNANYIGQIDDLELRGKIVNVYMTLQALMQGYETNTKYFYEYKELIDRHEEVKAQYIMPLRGVGATEARRNIMETKGLEVLIDKSLRQLKGYAPELKKIHKEYTDLIEDLLEELRKDLPQPRNVAAFVKSIPPPTIL